MTASIHLFKMQISIAMGDLVAGQTLQSGSELLLTLILPVIGSVLR